MPAIGSAAAIPFQNLSGAVFDLPLASSLTEGLGDLISFSRGDADATITDFEGLVRDATADEARFYGARRVENLFDGVTVSTTGTPTVTITQVGPNEWLIENLDQAQSSAARAAFRAIISTSVDGWTVNTRWEVKAYPGMEGEDIVFNTRRDGGTGTGGNQLTIAPTSEYVAYGSTPQVFSGGTGINLRVWAPPGSAATKVYVRRVQLEDSSGQLNTRPSEYVSVRTGTESELVVEQPVAADWTALGNNTVTDEAEGIKVTYVDNSFGAQIDLSAATFLQTDFLNNQLYAFNFDARVDPGNSLQVVFDYGTANEVETITQSTFTNFTLVARVNDPSACRIFFQNMNAGEAVYIKNLSFKRIDHGSNADRVKYFDYTNPAYYDPVSPSTQLFEFAINENQQPNGDFLINDTSSTGTDNPGWEWPSYPNEFEIINGALRRKSPGSAIAVTKKVKAIAGVTYKAVYTISGFQATIVTIAGKGTDIFGNALPTSVGTHTVYVNTNLNNIALFQIGSANINCVFESALIYGAYTIDDDTRKGVLIEQQSTNLITQSEDFQTTWTNSNITFGADQTSPRGKVDAERISATANGGAFLNFAINLPAAGSYTFSVYAKKGTNADWIALNGAGFTGGSFSTTYFDLTNGVVGPTDLNDDSGIEDIGNGWYRCWITAAAVVTDLSGSIRIYVADADADVTVTAGDDIYVWGAQVEQAPYYTSYIPSVGATTQRNQDELVYGWPIGELPDGISMVAESYALYNGAQSTGFPGQVTVFDSPSTAYAALVIHSQTGNAYSIARDSVNIIQGQQPPNIVHKNQFVSGMVIDITASPTVMKQFLNGTKKPIEYTNAAFTTIQFNVSNTQILIGASTDAIEDFNWPIKNVKIYAKPLSDSAMEQLTA